MHILEQYALNCGVKINKPYIYEKYISLPFEKYITFHPRGKFPSREYDYWHEVISLLNPILFENSINIVQIGAENEKMYEGCYSLNGQTNYNNVAYLIKNSLLHLGVDSFPIHIASALNKKIVGLYCNMYKEQSGPYWSKDEDVILLEADLNGKKPSYAIEENPKTINTIKPEDIANSVLGLLKINKKIPQKSLFFGKKYRNQQIIEIIPDHLPQIKIAPNEVLNIRMDLNFDESILRDILNFYPSAVISNKEINLNNLNFHNIKQFVYILEEDVNVNFLKQLENKGIKCALISFRDEEEVKNLKLKTMDFGNIFCINKKENEAKSLELSKDDNLLFKTNKLLLSKGQIYPSIYHFKNNISYASNLEKAMKFVHDESLFRDLDFNYIYKI